MVFEENVDEKYEVEKVYEVDGYKIAVNKDVLSNYDYIEIKYADNFLEKGFYPSILKPEDS